jgi:hypothetical protein
MKYQYNRMNEQIASLVGARPIALSNRGVKELPRCDDELLWFFNRIHQYIIIIINGVNYFITHGVNLY